MNVQNELRKLIGEEKWKLLQEKCISLDEVDYLVVCETCGKIFYEKSLAIVQDLMLSGK